MDEKKYLDQIFDQYVSTQELLELKDEISIHMHENIVDYLKKGMNKQEAFAKAVEGLGELDQVLGGFAKKKNIWKWLYYISGVSMVIGFLAALITFLDQIGWNGAFLSLGCLYPFCVIQPAYILWYKMKSSKKMGWRNLTGIAFAVSFFFIINIMESVIREKYYFGSMIQGLERIAGTIVLGVVSLVIAIYAWKKSNTSGKQLGI